MTLGIISMNPYIDLFIPYLQWAFYHRKAIALYQSIYLMDRSKRSPYPSWTAYFPKGNIIRTEDGPLPSDSRWCKSGLNGKAFKQSELLLTEELQQVSVIFIVSVQEHYLVLDSLLTAPSPPQSINHQILLILPQKFFRCVPAFLPFPVWPYFRLSSSRFWPVPTVP